MKRSPVLAAALVMSLGPLAHADARLSFDTAQAGNSRIAVKGDWVRMEDTRADAVTLYDTSSRQLTVIESAERRYFRMDIEAVKQKGRQVSEQMRQMQEQIEQQLQNLPEGQREMMRKQLEQMLPAQPKQDGAQPRDFRVEGSGASDSVAGVDCEIVTVREGGELVQEVCVARADDLGMAASDIETLRKMFGALSDMAGEFESVGGINAAATANVVDAFDGVPVRATDAAGNTEWALQAVETGSLDASVFRVPEGYREVKPFGADSQ